MATVKHIVIDADILIEDDLVAFLDMLPSMDDTMLQLPWLETVTLKMPENESWYRDSQIVDRLPSLHARGKIHIVPTTNGPEALQYV